MKRALTRRYPGPEGMFALSFVCHLVAFLIITMWQSSAEFHPDETPVTYVDMVTLPVASPQSGTPAPAAVEEVLPAAPAPPPAAPQAQAPAMTQPVKPSPKGPAQAQGKVEQPNPAAEAHAFNERMAKIEQAAQERRQAEVLERLRKKGTQTGKRTGMPGGKGDEAGSDYPSYLQSRLKDALSEVMVSQTKSPQVIATITVAPDGRIAAYHVEKGSGDPLFDDAVHRAVTLAGKTLVPPPGGAQFKRMFRFRPEGVGIR